MSRNPGYEGLSYLMAPKGAVSQIGPERGPSPRDGFAAWRSRNGSTRYVAIHEGSVVAALQVMSRDSTLGIVANAYTRPNLRRTGIGRHLVEMARKNYERLEFGADRSDDGRPFVEGVKKPGENPLRHRHPHLARPISASQFEHEFEIVCGRGVAFTTGPVPTMEFTEALAKTHERSCRRYAECQPRHRDFYFAPQVLWLPAANRLGLIAHEAGHCLMGARPHTEAQADAAALQHLGVEIRYDRRWPGKGLQSGRFVR